MARAIVEYDILIGEGTKRFIRDEGKANFTPSDSSYRALYVLSYVIEFLVDHKDLFTSDSYLEDINYLRGLAEDGVDFVEI